MSESGQTPGRPRSKDAAAEAYVEAIEAHLRARRGIDHILSPRDFALARSWHQAGVSLATVLVGMDRAFETGANVTSLAYCRRWVEELAAAGPTAVRPAPPAESVPLREVEGVLNTLLEQLAKIRPARGAFFDPPLRKIREVQDLVSVASRPNWSYVRSKLREIDDEVSAAVLEALSESDRAAFAEEAARAIERHRGRVDDDALRDAMHRFTLQRARERLGLPRVSLV
jgi:Arc/MetJ family transcription regulator